MKDFAVNFLETGQCECKQKWKNSRDEEMRRGETWASRIQERRRKLEIGRSMGQNGHVGKHRKGRRGQNETEVSNYKRMPRKWQILVVRERISNICIIGVSEEDSQNNEIKQTVNSLLKLHQNWKNTWICTLEVLLCQNVRKDWPRLVNSGTYFQCSYWTLEIKKKNPLNSHIFSLHKNLNT